MNQEKCYWETWFYNKYGFYPHETEKGIKRLKDDIKVIMENNDEYTKVEAYSTYLNDVIVYDHHEYCQNNNLKPV